MAWTSDPGVADPGFACVGGRVGRTGRPLLFCGDEWAIHEAGDKQAGGKGAQLTPWVSSSLKVADPCPVCCPPYWHAVHRPVA